jgi:hypothetical protein
MSTITFTNCKTTDLHPEKLRSVVKNFNAVFEKAETIEDFERQYINNLKGYSYHSLMEDGGEVVGYLSAIPYAYSYFGEEKQFCYLGGLYILPEYRKDSLAMFKLYRSLKEIVAKDDIALFVTVPNKNSHPYFIHALKWIDVDSLPWYALPLRYGNIAGKGKLFNLASLAYSKVHIGVNSLFTAIANKKDKSKNIFLLPHDPLMERQRYSKDHKKIKEKTFSAFYLVVSEEGIQTAYLIDFYNSKRERDSRSLYKAVQYISSHEKVDIILFVGTLGMKQPVLIKVPKKKEPRSLNFCVEILDDSIKKEDVLKMSSWNFGLYNFDVR